MASFSSGNAFINGLSYSAATCSSSTRLSPEKLPVLVLSSDRREINPSLVLKATLLGPPTRFEASKLTVIFMEEEVKKPLCTIPRSYTLKHCDFTANLTLAVSNSISTNKLEGWQTTLSYDDVVAEWTKVKDEICLHVHCYVSGPNLFQVLAAGFRYYIFSKELPLVLKAVVYGDSLLFNERPELMEAKVWVHFHSNTKKYNRIECWGPLKDAMQRTPKNWTVSVQNAVVQNTKKWPIPETIFHALAAFLL